MVDSVRWHPAILAVDGEAVKGYNPRVELYCPLDGYPLIATHREDGNPVFTCYTCGYLKSVPIMQSAGICAECEGAIIPGDIDYLCGACRNPNPVDQHTTVSRSPNKLKPAYRRHSSPNE